MTYLIVAIISIIILGIVFLKKGSTATASEEQKLAKDLKSAGYQQTKTSNCIKYSQKFDEQNNRVEIEISQAPKRQTKLDIDVYKDEFKIVLPNNVSPAFFEYAVFRNYNAFLEPEQIELLPNVQDETYFLRSASTHNAQDPISYPLIEGQLQKMFDLFNDFPFITEEDYAHPLFQALLQDGYTCAWEPQLMMLRFTKTIDTNHVSLYFVKAIKALFISASELTNASIQEDFRDDKTKLHHFNPTDRKEEVELADIFPTFEAFKKLELEFSSTPISTEEEE